LIGWKTISPRTINVYKNDFPQKNWIRIRLSGTIGNKNAAGTKIKIFESETHKLIWYEEIITYCKQAQQNYGYYFGETERHFGLGLRNNIDIEVEFYPSKKVISKLGVKANQIIRIEEDSFPSYVLSKSTLYNAGELLHFNGSKIIANFSKNKNLTIEILNLKNKNF